VRDGPFQACFLTLRECLSPFSLDGLRPLMAVQAIKGARLEHKSWYALRTKRDAIAYSGRR
jgi:hypothetical protein